MTSTSIAPARRAATALVIMAAALAGCQTSEALPTREDPSASGPFANVGYRGIVAKPITGTEIPNAEIIALQSCVVTAEQREAASWLRDWFAAISKIDSCDEWAQDVLATPRVRQGLVFILDRLSGGPDAAAACKTAAFKVFTLVEERHSLLSTWRSNKAAACTAGQKKEAADKRLEEFTKKLADISGDIDKFRNR